MKTKTAVVLICMVCTALLAVGVSAAVLLSSDEAAVLRGGGCERGVCPEANCGTNTTHCVSKSCDPLSGLGATCLTASTECNMIPNVPRCVAPSLAGGLHCPDWALHQHCGLCKNCICTNLVVDTDVYYSCGATDTGKYYQEEFLPCP